VRETGVGVALIGEGALAKPILWLSCRGQALLCQLRDFRQRLELAPSQVPAHGRHTSIRAREPALFRHEPLEVEVVAAQAGASLECDAAFIGWMRITLRTAWFGLTCALLAVALEVRPPARGMVVVCPAAAQEYFAHEMDEQLKLWKSRS
jgi:hypothetical protein